VVRFGQRATVAGERRMRPPDDSPRFSLIRSLYDRWRRLLEADPELRAFVAALRRKRTEVWRRLLEADPG